MTDANDSAQTGDVPARRIPRQQPPSAIDHPTREIDNLNAPRYDVDDLRGITDFDAALALIAQEMGGVQEIVTADQLGDGFEIIDDKERLVGVPLVFMSWTFHVSEYDRTKEFVAARVVARHGGAVGKYIVNDGSVGIARQLREFSDKTAKFGGLLCRNGLRKSEYSNEFTEAGVTFYIDTAAA